jgi:hypothetical protein
VRATAAGVLLAAVAAAAEPNIVTVKPVEESSAVLHNPDMGWVVYENYPLDWRPGGSSTLVTLPDEPFAGVDQVAIMFSWQDVEPRAGVYDFSNVDFAYDHWQKRGKQIQLRLSSESLLWWTRQDPPSGMGVPDHVLSRIPAERKQTRECEGIPYTVVDARNPVYLVRLEKFLAAVAAHFDSRRPVTLIDLRGFGLWGEWHTGYRYATVADRHAALCGIIDRYAAAFPKHYLSLSYSYDPDGPKDYWSGPTNRLDETFTTTYRDFLHYSAFDHALTKPNVTLRRDGAGGAVHSNERKLCDEAFRTRSKGPMMCEFLGGYAAAKKARPGHVDWMVEDALSLHPNYVALLGWQGGDGRDFLHERPDLIAHGLRAMGYRLVPTTVNYPGIVTVGAPSRLITEWVNRGVGRAVRDYRLVVSLADAAGKVVGRFDTGTLGCDRWIKGETYAVARDMAIRDVPAGRYELRLRVEDADGAKIALPLTAGRPDGSYRIGEMAVTTK